MQMAEQIQIGPAILRVSIKRLWLCGHDSSPWFLTGFYRVTFSSAMCVWTRSTLDHPLPGTGNGSQRGKGIATLVPNSAKEKRDGGDEMHTVPTLSPYRRTVPSDGRSAAPSVTFGVPGGSAGAGGHRNAPPKVGRCLSSRQN